MKVNVFNLIILDESGSMDSMRKAAVDGLNETIQAIQSAQKKHEDLQTHFVTLVSFNSDGIRTLIDNCPAGQVKLINPRDYVPNACTPLYDAMGISLSKLRSQLKQEEENQVLATIITDGMENASREFKGKMIKNMVQELKQLGWTFVYIGTNQDVDAVADSLSIDNRMNYISSPQGFRRMSQTDLSSKERYYERLSRKKRGEDVDLQEGYFDE